ncbi:hypothetical protein HYU22_05695 [Candidatus Woesearchaeota archaeon]|nr:hypothetical protein [Candidatus Woesearchaeota archaeon]
MDYSDGEGDPTDEQMVEQEALESSEEGFLKGYATEEELEECAECGTRLKEKRVAKEIAGEEYQFCSKACATEFEETMASTEE